MYTKDEGGRRGYRMIVPANDYSTHLYVPARPHGDNRHVVSAYLGENKQMASYLCNMYVDNNREYYLCEDYKNEKTYRLKRHDNQ